MTELESINKELDDLAIRVAKATKDANIALNSKRAFEKLFSIYGCQNPDCEFKAHCKVSFSPKQRHIDTRSGFVNWYDYQGRRLPEGAYAHVFSGFESKSSLIAAIIDFCKDMNFDIINKKELKDDKESEDEHKDS